MPPSAADRATADRATADRATADRERAGRIPSEPPAEPAGRGRLTALGRIAIERAAAAPFRTIRAEDLAQFSARPSALLASLAREGRFRRLSRGTYCLAPGADLGPGAGPVAYVDPFSGEELPWPPSVEAAAIAVASAIHGHGAAVLSGLSAARLLGIWLEPIAVAHVTVPVQQRPLPLDDHVGGILFRTRPLEDLVVTTRPTDLGPALVTCPEQTMLDLEHADPMHRNPHTWSVVRRLGVTCDRDLLDHLARVQRRRRTLDRILGLRDRPGADEDW